MKEDKNLRLDQALVTRGLVESRAQAQAAIAAGGVTVDGVQVTKPSLKVRPQQSVTAEKAHPYVSRGGLKLVAALEAFDLDVSGRRCLDIGASTGGFTEVLLEAGASHVVAVDVGRDQLHARLKNDPRVTSLEGLDARHLTRADTGEAVDLVVCDASFIGLEKVIETPLALTAPDAEAVLLFKPQFQVGPENVGKGGLVTNDAAIAVARDQFRASIERWGWRELTSIDSPIRGGDGNREYLLFLRRV